MKTVLFLSLLALSACSIQKQIALNHSFLSGSERKQKQKVIVLQKKLELAERALAKSQKELEALRMEFYDAELDSIESRLSALERKWQADPLALTNALYQETTRLFLEEREILYQILQAGVSMHRAQNLIDRILQLITQINDRAVRSY